MNNMYTQAYVESTLFSLRTAMADLDRWNMAMNGGVKREAIDAGLQVLQVTYKIMEKAIRNEVNTA